MDNTEARQWLDNAWRWVLKDKQEEPDSVIDRLVNSDVLSIRYAILTQIPGKIAHERRSLLFIQMGTAATPGTWVARSFCSAVIVPWVEDNHDVLEKSPDPYVNNPLRRPRLDEGLEQLRSKDEWFALVAFLSQLNSASRIVLEDAFIRCLKSVACELSAQSFVYQIPLRVSLPQMIKTLETFITEPSGGLRPLAVTAALMVVLGKAFSIFTEVASQGLNESDSSSGAPGDVMCMDGNDQMILAVEVKDRAFTLADVRSSVRKPRESANPLSNLLFAAPNIRKHDRDAIRENIETAWTYGLNISQIDIVDLASASFTLLAESWRPELLREIGRELDRRRDHRHRRDWDVLLSNMTGEEGE